MLSIEAQNRINQLNPWLVNREKGETVLSRFIPSEYILRDLEKTPTFSNRAFLIVGPRQAGKSTMIWHQLRQYSRDILFINMEDPLLRSALTNPIEFIATFRERYEFVKAVFIDEIQHMTEAGLFIKGLVDAKLNVPIWISGSSSFELLSKTRESLAGRAVKRKLLPFSITEIINHHPTSNPIENQQMCLKIIDHSMIYGTYPAVYLSDNVDHKALFLGDLVDSLILRDASDLYKIKRIDAFRKLLTLLAGQIGNLLNLSESASLCGVDIGTISSYIEILEESHIIKRLKPFAEGKRREITGTPKVFFIDNGIRNQLLNNFISQIELRTDKGPLFENWVFTEIYKSLPFQSDLKFWRSKSKAEVDFVIEHGGKTFAIEVKASNIVKPNVGKSIHSFLSAYSIKKLAIVNYSLEQQIELYDTQVEFITPIQLSNWLKRILIHEMKD
jgi:uncharacterized protein